MYSILLKILAFLVSKPLILAVTAGISGIAMGYGFGKISGYFGCNERIELLAAQAEIKSLKRDLEISKNVLKSDADLAIRQADEIAKLQEKVDEFTSEDPNGACTLSPADVERLRDIQ